MQAHVSAHTGLLLSLWTGLQCPTLVDVYTLCYQWQFLTSRLHPTQNGCLQTFATTCTAQMSVKMGWRGGGLLQPMHMRVSLKLEDPGIHTHMFASLELHPFVDFVPPFWSRGSERMRSLVVLKMPSVELAQHLDCLTQQLGQLDEFYTPACDTQHIVRPRLSG